MVSERNSSAAASNNNWITGNTITGAGLNATTGVRRGIIISYLAHHNLFENNLMTNITLEALDFHAHDEYSNEARYNVVKGCRYAGIALGNPGWRWPDDANGYYYDSGPNNWVHHNDVSGCGVGFVVEFLSHRQYIEDNYLHSNTYGIRFYNGGARGIKLLRNRVQNNEHIGVGVTGGAGLVMVGNVVSGNGSDPLVTDSATSTSAGGNGYGVRVEQPGANNNWVHSNEISGDGPGADKGIRHGVILSWSADRNAISNNTVRNTTWEGIDLHGLNENRNEVRNNTVSNCTGGGIAIGNPGVAVKDDPSPNDSGPYNWVHHNEVSGCDTGISIELLSHRQFIEDNYLHHNKVGIGVYNQGALHLRLMRNRVQRNRIGVWLTAASNVWVEGNVATNNETTGLRTDEDTSTVWRN